MKQKKPTIASIAKACGVSAGTVDRVVHGRAHVDPATREKIQAYIDECGYHPARRSAPTAKAVTVAILLPKWTDAYFTRQCLAGIHQATHAINDPNFHVITRELTGRSVGECLAAIDELTAQGVHGLILNAADDPLIRMRIDQAVANGVQVVTYDADIPSSKRVCFIGQNLRQAGAIAAGLMARRMKPHNEVLVVTGSLAYEPHRVRADGFLTELKQQGFTAYTLAECQERFDLTSQTVCQTLTKNPAIRYIYMASESVAGCLDGVRRARLPYQVHIICNDLTPAAKKYLQNRQIDFVIGQTFTQKANLAISVLYQLLCRGRRPAREKLYTDTVILTAEML